MDKLVPHKYGEFKLSQVDYYKQKLRKKIFWLVLYTDKNTKDDFKNIDVVKYHKIFYSRFLIVINYYSIQRIL